MEAANNPSLISVSVSKVRYGHSCRNLFKNLGIMPLPTLFIYEILILIKNNDLDLKQNKGFHNYFTCKVEEFEWSKLYEEKPSYIGIKFIIY